MEPPGENTYPLGVIHTTAVDKRRKISAETVFKSSMMENQCGKKVTSFKYFSVRSPSEDLCKITEI